MRKVVFYFLGGLLTAVLLFLPMALISMGLKGMHNNVLILLTFWFICVPIIAYSSSLILKRNNRLANALIGMFPFYSVIYFMIYELSDTDFFTVMKYSFVTSVALVLCFYYRKEVGRLFHIVVRQAIAKAYLLSTAISSFSGLTQKLIRLC